MDISIIIVNYNVKFFLEQCIRSVYQAQNGLSIEVIVVDNHSIDGSVTMVKEKFPEVILIENFTNQGFSKANNQGIKLAKGKYILLLNPDTVLQEDTLLKCFQFMETHPDAGALGVKMFDGKGNFLPESKRSLPTPSVAFYKIFGLSKIFPKSKIFGKYHLGYLDNDAIHKVEVLSGAFMFIRKEVLDKIGGLDEDYFMYGEDIDLSYRIMKARYSNYYFPYTSIIHYKGESTKKSSVNYVIVFYKAMIIFADKHFSTAYARFFHFLIYMAIYLRAGISVVYRILKKIILPLLDTTLIWVLLIAFSKLYEINYKLSNDYFDKDLLNVSMMVYAMILVISIFSYGGYEKHVKYKNIFQGTIIGFLIVLIIYSLLPESMRFSRAIIVSGGIISIIYFTITRWLFYYTGLSKYSYLSTILPKKIMIVGDEHEFARVKQIIESSNISTHYLGFVNVTEQPSKHPNFSGFLKDLEEIVQIEKIDEIIFCSKHLNAKDIIYWMTKLSYLPVYYKIAPPNELYIIGSNDIHSQGELYTLEFKTILLPENQRKKRLIDILLSSIVFISFPIVLWFFKNKKTLFHNWWNVMIGKKTWVGFGNFKDKNIPLIKPSVLFVGQVKGIDENNEKAKEICYLYSKDYKPITDVIVFFKFFHLLDKS